MSLGDRIKRYEASSRHFLTPRTPVIVRVDGRAFHTFTKGADKPFDKGIMTAMLYAAIDVAEGIQGFKAAYVQSDEATFLLTDYDDLETQRWFGYNLSKIISISAATMSVRFNRYALYPDDGRSPVFDSRAFNVPKEDVVNTFLWRAQDWERNSLQMYARSFFSHKELHKKNREDIHNMLHSIGKNWTTDLQSIEKNGTFIVATEEGLRLRRDILPSYESVNSAIGHFVK
jgi:tRNA(His) 5'-end guanylyltransferase